MRTISDMKRCSKQHDVSIIVSKRVRQNERTKRFVKSNPKELLVATTRSLRSYLCGRDKSYNLDPTRSADWRNLQFIAFRDFI